MKLLSSKGSEIRILDRPVTFVVEGNSLSPGSLLRLNLPDLMRFSPNASVEGHDLMVYTPSPPVY